MSTELHPDTRRMLNNQHEHLAEVRRRLRDALEATDKHIHTLILILNGRGDQTGLDHVTRKFVRAARDLGEYVDLYVKKYVVTKKDEKNNPKGGAA